MASYLLQEDGVSRFILEDGSGDILLEAGVTPPPPTPTGGTVFAVAPRRRILEKVKGRFRPHAAHVRVIAYAPSLNVVLAARAVTLTHTANTAAHRFSFRVSPARAQLGFWKRRSSDREQQIRRALIADLFDRDTDNR